MEKSQYVDPLALRNYQFIRLKEMLNHAYENTSYYRRQFDDLGICPKNIADFNEFKKFPVLTKLDLQANLSDIIAKNYNKDALIPFKTGGSTGKPITVFWDFNGMEKMTASAIRSFRWADWQIGEAWGRIWGNPPQNHTLKERLKNCLIEPQIFLDTMNLNETAVFEFVELWRKKRPTLLHGHAHSLYAFAKLCSKLRVDELRPNGIISTSMMLISSERETIENVFGCKVTDLYGCEEVGLIGCECEEHRGLHINAENMYVEFLDVNGRDVSLGQEGAIVVTSLINGAMPLIRYRIEDMGIPSERTCKCGRGLPLMETVSGRIADFLVRSDGSLVAGVSLIERTLTAHPGIEQMQIIQEDLATITLNIVRGTAYGTDTETFLRKEFKIVFGDNINIKFNYVEEILRNENGKYRFSISKVSNRYDDF
jgi:phenylacetate-CoA ligase